MIKNIFLLLIMTFLAPIVSAQNSVTIHQFLKDITIAADSLEIKTPKLSTTLSNYTLKKFNQTSFVLHNGSSNLFKFYLNSNNGKYTGSFFYEGFPIGYALTGDKEKGLNFKETTISEIIYYDVFDYDTTQNVETIPSFLPPTTPHPIYFGNATDSKTVYNLESRSSSKNVIYLDFDGEPSLKGWSNEDFPREPIRVTDEFVRNYWQSVSEDFLAFDVNITTNRNIYDQASPQNRIMVVNENFFNISWIGLANSLKSWGRDESVLVQGKGHPAKSIFNVASHELGHALGLNHDGLGVMPYYHGHGEYSPIMGNGWLPVGHWSKGEYDGANNKEDDIAIIGNKLGFSVDDILTHKDLYAQIDGVIQTEFNNGIINNQSDTDYFKFETIESGNISITVGSPLNISKLDVLLTLEDSKRNIIKTVNPIGERSATISQTVPAGVYYLKIDGGSELTPFTGFTDYGSFGYYTIEGVIEKPLTNVSTDIAIISIDKVQEYCKASLQPSVNIFNNGTKDIANIDIDVYIDNVFERTESVVGILQSGLEKKHQLLEITNPGFHTLKLILKVDGDQIAYNNEKRIHYNLQDGFATSFETDFIDYRQLSSIGWTIVNSKSLEIVSSSETEVITVKDNKSNQKSCLAKGCYKFEIFGDFEDCRSPYAEGIYYNAGDKVSKNGIIYKAKWWNNIEPPSTEWEHSGKCNEGIFSYYLTNKISGEEIISGSSNQFSGLNNKNFCVGDGSIVLSSSSTISSSKKSSSSSNSTSSSSSEQTTNVSENWKKRHLFFANGNNLEITIPFKKLTIVNLNGSIFHRFYNSEKINLNFIPLGMYRIILTTENGENHIKSLLKVE